jgi:monoamine oxidase
VKRRSALKHIGAGLSAGLVLPWLTSCKDDEVNPAIPYGGKVGIIGAGAAGLFAGDYLLEQGIDIEIFEASGRIGGRVRTLRTFDTIGPGLWFNQQTKLSSDFPVELGADRILGDDSTWAKFVAQQKYATLPLPASENDLFWINGSLVDYATALTDPEFQNAQTFLLNLFTNTGSAQSVQQAIEAAGIGSEMYAVLNGWIGNKYGTSNNRLGVAGIAEAAGIRQRSSVDLLLGHNPMADVLIGSFIRASEKTQLNTVVKEINYQDDKIIVAGEKIVGGVLQPFTSTVDKLLITVPISVLQSGDITFTPALPNSKALALSRMGMDSAIRVILDFRKNFWSAGFRNIYGGEKGMEYFNPGTSGRSTVARTMSVTISGEKAEELSLLGLDIIPELLGELDLIYEGQASSNVRLDPVNDEYVAVVQDWSKEPFIKGSSSYLKVGGSNVDRENLAEPVKDKLFFAGEATDITGEAGTVNGALVSAERAAKEIIASIIA